jgi:hypothetical protein
MALRLDSAGHAIDSIYLELLLCPECREHVHTSPAEGVPNQALRACNRCDAVFFMDLDLGQGVQS